MTANPTPLPPEGVTQADRDAAAQVYQSFRDHDFAKWISQGTNAGGDYNFIIQLFARHRIAATSAAEDGWMKVPSVEQSDRDATADLYLLQQGDPYSPHDQAVASAIRLGEHDEWDHVKALAQHREKSIASFVRDNKAGGLWYRRWFKAEARATKAEAANARLMEAVEPLARLEIPKKPQGNAGTYSIFHSDILRARGSLDQGAEG